MAESPQRLGKGRTYFIVGAALLISSLTLILASAVMWKRLGLAAIVLAGAAVVDAALGITFILSGSKKLKQEAEGNV